MEDTFCTSCGNKGTKEGCPECGREHKILYQDKTENQIASTLGYLEKVIRIPEGYLGNRFVKQVLMDEYTGKKREEYRKYIDNLDMYIEIFRNGRLPQRSTFVASPTGNGKKVMAYTCMELANDNNYTISPILSTLDISFIIKQSIEFKPDFKFNGVGYMDLYEIDFLVVQISHTDYKYESYKVIQELLNMRTRYNKSTLVLSDFGIDTITDWDDQYNFVRLFQTGFLDNKQLYPTMICYDR